MAQETESSNSQQVGGNSLKTITAQNLQTIQASPTAMALQESRFDLVVNSVGNSVKDLLDKPNILMLSKVVEPSTIEKFLAVQIQFITEQVNVDQRLNIQNFQIPQIAAQLIESYPVESLEDFVLCFKRGALGFYGSIYRLDAAVLNEWLKSYFEEKYGLIEAKVHEVKKPEIENKVDYKAWIERKAKESATPVATQNNAKDNEYERYKLERKKTLRVRLDRAASEYYVVHGRKGQVKVFEDEAGNYILAETAEDSENIYFIANHIEFLNNGYIGRESLYDLPFKNIQPASKDI